jgi:hypothetical protein
VSVGYLCALSCHFVDMIFFERMCELYDIISNITGTALSKNQRLSHYVPKSDRGQVDI